MRPYQCSLLVVDDEPLVCATLLKLLGDEYVVQAVGSAEAALELLARQEFDLILADQRLPGQSGVQLLEWVREQRPRTVRLLMTGLARFEDALEAINRGQVARFVVKPWHREDLRQILRDSARTVLLERSHEGLLQELRQLNLELEERVQQRTRELQEANRQLEQKNLMLEKLALTDPLTGLPNRRAMEHLTQTELRRRQRFPAPLTLGILDIDHFKEINGRYLLPGGDQVLVQLGETLTAALRTVDSVGRVGGEEFEILAPGTNHEGALVLAERMRATVEQTQFQYHGASIPVTASIGLAVAESEVPAEYEQLRHVAAFALAEAKSTGRNRCVVYSLGNLPLALHASLEAQ